MKETEWVDGGRKKSQVFDPRISRSANHQFDLHRTLGMRRFFAEQSRKVEGIETVQFRSNIPILGRLLYNFLIQYKLTTDADDDGLMDGGCEWEKESEKWVISIPQTNIGTTQSESANKFYY